MKSIFTRVLLLSVLAVLVAACGASGPEEVTFMISGEPAELESYQTLVDRFKEEHSDIDVSLIYVASGKEFREKLGTMFSGNVPPDIFLYNYRRLGDYAEAGAVQPLGDRLDASSLLDRNDYYPAALDAFTYKGQLQCFPQNLSSPVIYYNKALFQEAGLEFPQAGWTQDDFLADAQALTQDRDGDGNIDQWGFGTKVETIRLAPFIWSNGGDFLDNPSDPTALTLSEPAARDAIEWFVDLQRVYGVSPDLTAETAQSSEDRFLNGSVAMYMNSRVGVPTLRTIQDFEWDAAPLPLGDRPASVLHSDGFCMSNKAAEDADHADKVWTFIEYALSETGQTNLAETGRTVPSMIRVAESPAFLESSPPANNQVYLDAADHMRALPMLPGWNTFEELFSKELQRTFYGDSDVDELLARADELAAPLLQR